MPIYAYRCSSCGHSKDVLQKLSDPLLTACPACGQEAFSKQVTAAGFQLKGSGWYVTDFRGGEAGKASDGANSGVGSEAKPAVKTDAKAANASAATPASAPAATPTSAPASAPATSATPPVATKKVATNVPATGT